MVFGCEEEEGVSDVWLGLLEWEVSPFCEMRNERKNRFREKGMVSFNNNSNCKVLN